MSMDIEDLNKSQLVLLVLLVSFVTSIATGIVTVSLMEKAPQDVVRVVQRVVEKTVEKVEQNSKKESPEQKVIVQEKTIIVKEGDLIAQSIAQNRNKLLSIYDAEGDKFVAQALPVSAKELVTDASVIDPEKKYIAKDSKGNIFNIELIDGGGSRAVAVFKSLDSNFSLIDANENKIKLGNSVFFFTDEGFNKVSQAIVSSLNPQTVEIDLNTNKLNPGTVIFDSSGNYVGISTSFSRSEDDRAFVKSVAIKAALEGYKKDSTSTEEKDEPNNKNKETEASEQNTNDTSLNNSDANSQATSAANTVSTQGENSDLNNDNAYSTSGTN